MKIKLLLSFLGTAYCGWQYQDNARSVQQTVQDAVEKVFLSRYPVTGCSRTDSGVHADGFVCTVQTDASAPVIPLHGIVPAMNRFLPPDIAVLSAEEVSDSFHPRYDAVQKTYRYLIWNAPVRSPMEENRAYHYPRPLKIDLMQQAGKLLRGEHDFSAFCATGGKTTDHTRTVFDVSVSEQNHLITVMVTGNGFLYNMVRIIAGTLLECGNGKLSPLAVPQIIESKNRALAGSTLPACGLYLHEVRYESRR